MSAPAAEPGDVPSVTRWLVGLPGILQDIAGFRAGVESSGATD